MKFPYKLYVLFCTLICNYAYKFLKVMIFANENSKFTRFLTGNGDAFELYFKQSKIKCDQPQEVEKLYTLRDVYNQVNLIVDSVSYHTVHIKCLLWITV